MSILHDPATQTRLRATTLNEARVSRFEEFILRASSARAQSGAIGGLLHDFSNLITGISSLSANCSDSIDQDHPLQEDLQLLRDSSNRAHTIVRQIAEINGERRGERALVDLGEFVKSQVYLLKAAMPNGVNFAVSVEEGEFPLMLDRVWLRQGLMHLIMGTGRDTSRGKDVEIYVKRFRSSESKYMEAIPEPLRGRDSAVAIGVEKVETSICEAQLEEISDPKIDRLEGLGERQPELYFAVQFANRHNGQIDFINRGEESSEIIFVLPLMR